jgi:hypothetical protein
MKKLIALSLFFAVNIFAQPADYWQQHVSYTISGTLIDSIHSFDGKLSVVYANNSPDTLHEVWFHLYYNAFQPGSMMHERSKTLNDRGVAEKIDHYKRSDWGEQKISNVSVDGNDAKFEITGTVMKVILSKPLAPKSSINISLPFFVTIPPLTRRGGWMNADGIKYSMSQWYPKICEYDREGWHHQEYIAREFYGVYGDFDVTMNVPSKFCVGSTGQCQNPEEAGWGYDQIAKGVKKGKAYPDSVAKAKPNPMTSWHFKASNVHDFAWVAHEYIHEWGTWSDTVTVHCLYKPSEEKYWAEAMPNTFKMLDHHSKKVGWYQYRNFTNTHGGDGGMEYPQLIMDGSPGLGLIMHEGGHQWFYGMIGNNETRYAYLDEGFTEFIEMTGVEATYGRHHERDPYRDTSWLTRMFIPEPDMRRDYYRSYLDLAAAGYEEPLTIPHDWFRESVNAGQVYFKTLAGLAQLEYVLGDSVFWAGMKEYFLRWHFHHPNLNDFKRTMQDVSGADLDYYFDEWFGSTKTVSYGIYKINSDKQDDGTFKTTIKGYNAGLAVLPVDLTLHYEDGSTGIATIPLSVNQGLAYKKPEGGRIFFSNWDWVKTHYNGSAITPKEVDWVEIDTSYRMMDLFRADNARGGFLFFPKTEWTLWKQEQNYPPLSGLYGVFRPIVWYGQASGLNLGVGLLLGDNRHFSEDAKIIINTNPKPILKNSNEYLSTSLYEASKEAESIRFIDFQIKGNYNTKLLGNLTTLGYNVRKMYGIFGVNINLEHVIRPTYLYLGPTNSINFYYDYTNRGVIPNRNYPVYGPSWSDGAASTVGIKYSFRSHEGTTKFSLGYEKGGFWNDSTEALFYVPGNYHYFSSADFKITQYIPFTDQPFIDQFYLLLRGSAQANWGVLPLQKYYGLGAANGSEDEQNSFWQSVTSISKHFSTQANFINEGGAGVRGYYSKLSYSGFGLSSELILPNPLRSLGWLPNSFIPLLFADAGWIGNIATFKKVANEIATDAGIGVKWNILSWLPWQLQGIAQEYSNIPTIGIYFPLYLNHPDDGKGNFAFRYVISLGTTF